jgi:hypothetical protein
LSNSNLLICVAGLLSACTGIWVNWGAGYALLVGGVVLFVAGGLSSAREAPPARH